MILPSVHLNGSDPKTMAEQTQAARQSLRDTIDALVDMAPNGRDYYPQGDTAFATAAREHQERLAKLTSVARDLDTLLEHLLDAMGQ